MGVAPPQKSLIHFRIHSNQIQTPWLKLIYIIKYRRLTTIQKILYLILFFNIDKISLFTTYKYLECMSACIACISINRKKTG